MKNELKLISMSEIQTEEVKWLWHPYIVSEKQGGQWYWRLPDQGCKDVSL